MPSYKLYYFAGRGRAELPRLMFKEAGVPFVDERITDWPNHKAEMPFGQMPVLEVDGFKLSQSGAIVNYLARELKLIDTKCNLSHAKVEELLGAFGDCTQKLPYFESDPEKKAATVKEQVDSKIVPMLEKLEGKVAGSTTYLKEFSFADLGLVAFVDSLNDFDSSVIGRFPKLKKVYDSTAARPKVAAYLATRPKTQF
uniref:glutathione transferase n=1 Tax=Ciona savignyi TaxID=51511 RepID=H2ZGW6_CIOSA